MAYKARSRNRARERDTRTVGTGSCSGPRSRVGGAWNQSDDPCDCDAIGRNRIQVDGTDFGRGNVWRSEGARGEAVRKGYAVRFGALLRVRRQLERSVLAGKHRPANGSESLERPGLRCASAWMADFDLE